MAVGGRAMEISGRAEQGLRLVVALAAHHSTGAHVVKREELGRTHGLSKAAMDEVLRGLRTRGLLHSHRGRDGGWSLARAPERITVADVIAAIDGPLCRVAGVEHRPGPVASDPLERLWLALAASMTDVLDSVSVAELAASMTRIEDVR